MINVNLKTNKFFLFVLYSVSINLKISFRFLSRFTFKKFILGKYFGKKKFLGKILIFERYETDIRFDF